MEIVPPRTESNWSGLIFSSPSHVYPATSPPRPVFSPHNIICTLTDAGVSPIGQVVAASHHPLPLKVSTRSESQTSGLVHAYPASSPPHTAIYLVTSSPPRPIRAISNFRSPFSLQHLTTDRESLFPAKARGTHPPASRHPTRSQHNSTHHSRPDQQPSPHCPTHTLYEVNLKSIIFRKPH